MSGDPLSLERVRALIEQWRRDAAEQKKIAREAKAKNMLVTAAGEMHEAETREQCADELEAIVGQDGASPRHHPTNNAKLRAEIAQVRNDRDALLSRGATLEHELSEWMERHPDRPTDAIECGWCDGKGWLASDDPAFTLGAEPPTAEDLDNLRHMLGVERVPGGYRNYFVAGADDVASMERLRVAGLVVKNERYALSSDPCYQEPILMYGLPSLSNDVIAVANVPRLENAEHPTPKPLPLMASLLARLPAGVVLDPFMGSGTTLVAAKQNHRRAIGIDINERYCEIAARRLRQEALPLSMEEPQSVDAVDPSATDPGKPSTRD